VAFFRAGGVESTAAVASAGILDTSVATNNTASASVGPGDAMAQLAVDIGSVSETVNQLDVGMMDDAGYGEVKSPSRCVSSFDPLLFQAGCLSYLTLLTSLMPPQSCPHASLFHVRVARARARERPEALDVRARGNRSAEQ
jgi:hypothetical protein